MSWALMGGTSMSRAPCSRTGEQHGKAVWEAVAAWCVPSTGRLVPSSKLALSPAAKLEHGASDVNGRGGFNWKHTREGKSEQQLPCPALRPTSTPAPVQ